MHDELVSIIITTYNRRHLITQTIDSCLSQTYRNFEIIVVDDGSTDDTIAVLQKFIKAGQIVYYYKKNEERAVARNTGIQLAKGRYIKFLDSDDLLDQEYLAVCTEYFSQDENCELIYTNCKELNKEGNITLSPNKKMGSNLYELLWEENKIALSSVIMKKTVFEKYRGFDETLTLSGAEDWEYWVRLSKQGCNFCFVPHYVSIIRMHDENSTMNDIGKILFSAHEAVKLLESKFEIKPDLKQKFNARLIYLQAVYSYINRQKVLSLKFLFISASKNSIFLFKKEFWILFMKNILPQKFTNLVIRKLKY